MADRHRDRDDRNPRRDRDDRDPRRDRDDRDPRSYRDDRDRRRDRDDRERDRYRSRRSRTPDRTARSTRHTHRSHTRSPSGSPTRSRSRSVDHSRHRTRRRTPSPDHQRRRKRDRDEYDHNDRKAVSDFVDEIANEHEKGTNKKHKKSSAGDRKDGESNGDMEGVVEEDDEMEMMKMMGIPVGFDSTKGKPVPGADVSGVRAITKRQPRQYMNRRGGFNRPLPPERNR